jgi:Fe-S cluster assembly ATP-binding protein
MLQLDKIVLKFKADDQEISVLNGISLHFETGKMYVITGPNGSGKSSLARVIMGIHRPGGGRIIFEGEDITGLGITERSRKGIGYAFQHPARFKGLRVTDILEIAMRGSDSVDCRCLSKIGLCPEDYLERPLDASLSGGEIKRIEIATLLALNPRLRIFDEPEAGIDLWSFEQLIEVIGASHRPDTTTIIISHQEKILNMADQIILLEDGAVSMHGPREQVWPLIRDSVRCACRQECSRGGKYYVDCPR